MIEGLESHAGKLEASVIAAAPLGDYLPAITPMSLESLALTRIQSCRSFVRENDRGVLILHSSGTTGLFAKPIRSTQSSRLLPRSAKGHPSGTSLPTWVRRLSFISR